MKKFTDIQTSLLSLLQDGHCHSGTVLGKKLGISRSAIWKQINQLQALGILITSSKQGYQLSEPFRPLNTKEISDLLDKQSFPSPYQLHLFSSLDSTNTYLKTLPPSSDVQICCSETQTQGRGRFGRSWYSPFGENIYFSMRWQLTCDLSRLAGLSLIISLAVIKILKQTAAIEDLKVKWPNDILWKGKKLCGSLVEIVAETNSSAMVIVGVGLNVNSKTANNPLPDKPWCSLYDLTQQYFNRNGIIAHLAVQLDNYLHCFLKNGLQAFIPQWNAYDALFEQKITVSQPTGQISGVAKGISALGQLILENERGDQQLLSSGDTSLHL